MVQPLNVAFIGAGSMAESIMSGLINQEKLLPENIFVTNRQNQDRLNELSDKYGVQVSASTEFVLAEADVVILAMKPIGVKDAIDSMRSLTNEKQLFLSVLAGITTDYISHLLGHNAPVVRVMPNTSSAVGSSATVITPGKHVKDQDLQIAKSLFEAVGLVKEVKEKDLDGFTAIAGSGPAYIYYLVESLYKSADDLYLDKQLSEELIIQMIQGVVDVLKETGQRPRELYQNVISPGGTTEAGLHVLEKHNFQQIMIDCIKQAAERSNAITKQMSIIPV